MALTVIVTTLLLSAFFSGAEIAFVAANRLRVEMRARRIGLLGRLVTFFFASPARLLTTTLVGNNIALVIFSTVMAIALSEPLSRFISGESPQVIVQTIIAAIIVLLIGEILPKTLMRETATRAVFVLAAPLAITYVVLLPLILLVSWTSQLLVKRIGSTPDEFTRFSRRALEQIIEENVERGSLDLDAEETELLTNVFGLHAKRTRECLTPRTEIVAISEDTSLEDFRHLCIESGYSKIPVYRENIDTIVGIAFAYNLFESPATLEDVMRPARFVPESKPAKELLREFRDSHRSIVIVIDEYGGTAGLITREDLLEELFGDIQDEFDTEDVVMSEIAPRIYLFSGKAEIDEINERFDLSIPEGEFETIAGYILDQSGSIPSVNDRLILERFRIEILKASRNRIDLIRLSLAD
ncbi:MAG: hemolysin family protein [Bacteroidetes bacterium]|nr:hemolysin family protein [Bacteroidota bacterium]MCY4205669.1 hemolysin family protein [Bacteroidota bacterium]